MDTATYKMLIRQYDDAGYGQAQSQAARHAHAVAGYLARFLERSADGHARNRKIVAERLDLAEKADPAFARKWIAAVRKAVS